MMLTVLISYLHAFAFVEVKEKDARASVHDRMQMVWTSKSSMMILTSLTFSFAKSTVVLYCVSLEVLFLSSDRMCIQLNTAMKGFSFVSPRSCCCFACFATHVALPLSPHSFIVASHACPVVELAWIHPTQADKSQNGKLPVR